jgi:hypothetical protein
MVPEFKAIKIFEFNFCRFCNLHLRRLAQDCLELAQVITAH